MIPPSPNQKLFQFQDFCHIGKVPLENFLVQNHCDIPLQCINFFDIRIFMKHRRVTLPTFSVLWDKKISTKDRDTTPLLSIGVFGRWKFVKHRNFPPQVFSARSDKKSQRKTELCPSCSWTFFDIRNFLKSWRIPRELFGPCETKKELEQKTVIAPSLSYS